MRYQKQKARQKNNLVATINPALIGFAFHFLCAAPHHTIHIGGMTMNERLYCFSLFKKFDACKNDKQRDVIYAKVEAKR